MVSELDKLIKTYHSFECEFDIDKSIEVCKEILEIDPNLIEYQEKLACNYFDIEKYGKSIDLYKKCIEEGGDRETSIFMIALAYVKMNDREKALEYASKAGNKQVSTTVLVLPESYSIVDAADMEESPASSSFYADANNVSYGNPQIV